MWCCAAVKWVQEEVGRLEKERGGLEVRVEGLSQHM